GFWLTSLTCSSAPVQSWLLPMRSPNGHSSGLIAGHGARRCRLTRPLLHQRRWSVLVSTTGSRLPLADRNGMTSVRGPAVARHSGMSYMATVAYGVRVTEIPAAVAAELARLRAENARLLKMLELSPRQAAPPGPAQAGFFDAPPGPVHKDSPND